MENNIFWAVMYSIRDGAAITMARHFTEAEQMEFSDWFRPVGVYTVGDVYEKCPNLIFSDLPKRESDILFCGGNNTSWTISEEEKDELLALNQIRQDKKDADNAEAEARRKAEEEAEAKAKELDHQRLISLIDAWDVKSRTSYDEGGETTDYIHTFRINGQELSFAERNVFDCGTFTNPLYSIAPGYSGGFCAAYDGDLWWYSTNGNGVFPVRKLTDDEKICCEIIKKYGGTVGQGIRM